MGQGVGQGKGELLLLPLACFVNDAFWWARESTVHDY